MLKKINSVMQPMHSFIRPMRWSLCSNQQIITRINILALAAILAISNGFLIADETSSESNEAFSDCVQGCRQYNMTQSGYCIRDCMIRHLS